MKNFFLLLSFASILIISCNNSENESEEITIEASSEKIEEQPVPQNKAIAPGEYIEYHPNGGIKMKGIYSETLQREGLWISYYDNGIKWSESYYSNGKQDGHSLTFYPNGKIRYIGEYINGEKTGTWTFYDDSGNISKEEKY